MLKKKKKTTHGPKHNRKKKLQMFMEKLAEKNEVSQNIYFSFVKHLIVLGKPMLHLSTD